MEIRRVRDVVESELSQPGARGAPCYLLLTFSATLDETADRGQIALALPWLEDLPQGRIRLAKDLRSHGLGVVACESEREAYELLRQLRGNRLAAQVLARESPGRARAATPGTRAGTLAREIRRQHGVYSTPPPVTVYLARSVHRLLQAKLGWSAGLADPRVRLLDPAAGSLNFVRAAWRLALEDHWHRGGEGGELVREHLLPHFRGIELLPEAHARGLAALRRVLRAYGQPFDPAEVGLVCTLGDALAPVLAPALVPIPAIHEFPANVILGNPPWRGRSGRAEGWIGDLLAAYFQMDGEPLNERNAKWLQDDAVKFLRLAEWKIDQAGEGIAALVLPHNGIDAPTFRGLRRSLLTTFDEIYALDLHGNRRKREKSPGGEPDENVFPEVSQGAALFLLVKKPGLPKRVLRADLYGRRSEKLAALAGSHVGTTRWEEVQPAAPAYLFVDGDNDWLAREYRRGLSLPEIFPLFSTGVITGRDRVVTDPDRQILVERLERLAREGAVGAELDAGRREELRRDASWPERIRSFLAGPFDHRFLLYADAFLERPRTAVMAHMESGDNLALVASRQTRGAPGALVTPWIAGHKAASTYDVSSLFPLYLSLGPYRGEPGQRVANLAPELLTSLAERYGTLPQPEEVLGYVYAVLYDPAYRARYKKLLKRDFARIPFPSERGPFLRTAALGAELIGLHRLADPRLAEPSVRLAPGALAAVGASGALGAADADPDRLRLGSGRRTYILYQEKEGRLYVNGMGLYFEGISPEVFDYEIGGHPVLARWLRPRAGRVLSPEGAATFCRIAAALALTLEVQAKITESGAGPGDAC